jgi:uncharacterized Zn finger protein (UPF0148 family)
MSNPKPPLYRDGELICPNCKTPLLTDEGLDGKFYCAFCKREVGRLTEETMKRMVDDFPAELLREWLIEMQSLSS